MVWAQCFFTIKTVVFKSLINACSLVSDSLNTSHSCLSFMLSRVCCFLNSVIKEKAHRLLGYRVRITVRYSLRNNFPSVARVATLQENFFLGISKQLRQFAMYYLWFCEVVLLSGGIQCFIKTTTLRRVCNIQYFMLIYKLHILFSSENQNCKSFC